MAIEYGLYAWVPDHSDWIFWKYINLFSCVNQRELLLHYRNIPWGGGLIEAGQCVLYGGLLGIVFLFFVLLWIQSRKRQSVRQAVFIGAWCGWENGSAA